MYNPKKDRGERYWNMFLVSMTLFLALYMMFQFGRWALREEPKEKPERAELVYVPPVEELSEECMVLLPPEVSEEPRYRIGRGEECRP